MAVTALAFVIVGYKIMVRCWGRRATALELWCAALVVASALWMASIWLAALTSHLDRGTLLVRSAIVGALAIFLMSRRDTGGRESLRGVPLLYVLPAIPVVLWIAFILWRATVLPPLSHDALSYHLPRAVFFTRLNGFDHLQAAPDLRLRTFPANYEMLLSDVLLIEGDDALTEWIGTFYYVCFVIACGALARRWWGDGMAPAYGTMLLAASVPVALLHSGADKNDVMVAFFMVAGLVFAGRWITERDRIALVLATLAFACAIGTKPQAVILAGCIAPFMLWALIRAARAGEITRRFAAGLLVLTLSAVGLLGGVTYLSNFRNERAGMVTQGVAPYDDWVNLWQGPWILLTAPFSESEEQLYVPWERAPWFWKKYEIYFSHLGVPFAVSALLLPFGIAIYRRDVPGRSVERVIVTVAGVASFFLILPARFVPHGLFTTALARYVLFFVPLVFAWTVAPAMRRLSLRREMYGAVSLIALSLWFSREAIDNAMNDRFVPIDYLSYAAENRGTRIVPFDPWRAAILADRFAGPDDKIAIDGGFGAWLHPAFGKALRRPVELIAPGSGPPVIPDDAKWVVVDQAWGMIWAHPSFKDLSQAPLYLSKGQPTPEETRVFRFLREDPRFRLIYYNARRNQALFQRRPT